MKRIPYAIFPLIIAAAVLAGCSSVKATANKLTGADSNPTEKASAKSLAWLTDREWALTGFNTGTQFIPLEPGHGSDAWIRFAADGSLAGYTGTNNFMGSWKLGAKNPKGEYPLVLTLGAMTRKAALNEIAARFEITYLENLKKSVTLAQAGSGIELLAATKDRQLSFAYLGPEGAE